MSQDNSAENVATQRSATPEELAARLDEQASQIRALQQRVSGSSVDSGWDVLWLRTFYLTCLASLAIIAVLMIDLPPLYRRLGLIFLLAAMIRSAQIAIGQALEARSSSA
jgi:hypothetical protein